MKIHCKICKDDLTSRKFGHVSLVGNYVLCMFCKPEDNNVI